MSTTTMETPVSLSKAARLLAEERGEKVEYTLIRYLVAEHRIPVTKVGVCHVLNAKGLRQLRKALAEFRAKSDAA